MKDSYGALANRTAAHDEALNRLEQSTTSLPSATPDLATQGGTPLLLDGDFSATFGPGTLQVLVTHTQGTRDEAVDYVAELEGYTTTQIDVLAPARPEQDMFDLYVSALDGATRVYFKPLLITYGPHVIDTTSTVRATATRCTRSTKARRTPTRTWIRRPIPRTPPRPTPRTRR